jgi:hypothetical protein
MTWNYTKSLALFGVAQLLILALIGDPFRGIVILAASPLIGSVMDVIASARGEPQARAYPPAPARRSLLDRE